METNHAPPRPPITDNPWFWVYLFGTVALIGGMLMGNKVDQRQEQADANFTRRQELLEQRAAGKTARPEPFDAVAANEGSAPEQETRYVSFQPLYVLLAIATVVAWCILWWQHFRPVATPHDGTGNIASLTSEKAAS